MKHEDFRNSIKKVGSLVQGGSRLPFLTRFMKAAFNMDILHLTLYLITWVLICAGVITMMFHYGDCFSGDISLWNGYILSTALILGGGGPEVRAAEFCPTFSLLSTIIAFVTDVGVISVFVNKVTNPQSEVLFADNVVVRNRNGETLLQFRFMNAYGHAMIAIEVKVFYYHSVKSSEGENYTAIVELPVQCSNFGGAYPLNINVVVEEDSPLWNDDFCDFQGSIHVTMTGFDTLLQTQVTNDRWYNAAHMLVGHDHANAFIKGVARVVKEGGRVEISSEKFHTTSQIEPEAMKILEMSIKNKRDSKRRRDAEALENCQSIIVAHQSKGEKESMSVSTASTRIVREEEDSPVVLDVREPIKKKRSLLNVLKIRKSKDKYS